MFCVSSSICFQLSSWTWEKNEMKGIVNKFLDHLKVLFTTCASSHQLEVLVYPCFLEFKIKYQVENMKLTCPIAEMSSIATLRDCHVQSIKF